MNKSTKPKADKAKASHVTASSGNVFADLNVADSQEALAKAELARQIGLLITASDMTQTQAGQVLGIDQPKVSALLRGRLESFSTDRLIRFLTALGQDVEIVVRPRSRRPVKHHHALRVITRKQSA